MILKPCPFCGGEASGPHDVTGSSYYVHCNNCGLNASWIHGKKGIRQVWNNRPREETHEKAPETVL